MRDRARGVDVLLDERRRHAERGRDVREAVDLDLGRQVLLGIDLDVEQRLHGAGVLGSVQALRRDVAGVVLARARSIERSSHAISASIFGLLGCGLPGGGMRRPRSFSRSRPRTAPRAAAPSRASAFEARARRRDRRSYGTRCNTTRACPSVVRSRARSICTAMNAAPKAMPTTEAATSHCCDPRIKKLSPPGNGCACSRQLLPVYSTSASGGHRIFHKCRGTSRGRRGANRSRSVAVPIAGRRTPVGRAACDGIRHREWRARLPGHVRGVPRPRRQPHRGHRFRPRPVSPAVYRRRDRPNHHRRHPEHADGAVAGHGEAQALQIVAYLALAARNRRRLERARRRRARREIARSSGDCLDLPPHRRRGLVRSART